MGITFINTGGGSGDMTKATYDSNEDGVIDSGAGGSASNMTITAKTDTYVIDASDFGIDKALSMNSAQAKTFTLPSVAAGDIGKVLTFIKLGAGRVTLDAADSDTIHDSAAGGTLYNAVAGETYASATIMLTAATKWSLINSSGIGWITT